MCILCAAGYLVRLLAPETVLQLWRLYSKSMGPTHALMRSCVRPVCASCALLVTWCAHLHQKLCYNCGAFMAKPRGQLTLPRAHARSQCVHPAPLRSLLVTWCGHLHQKLRYNCGACIIMKWSTLAPARSCVRRMCASCAPCWLPGALTCTRNFVTIVVLAY